jgi:hypothetical protein
MPVEGDEIEFVEKSSSSSSSFTSSFHPPFISQADIDAGVKEYL